MIPENLKYSKEHEWVKMDGEVATIGITHYAQDQLGDIVYVELPKVGAKLSAMQEFGVAESVKTVSTLYCPIAGEVTEANSALNSKPEVVNDDPYGAGWIIKVKAANAQQAHDLLSPAQYKELTEKK